MIEPIRLTKRNELGGLVVPISWVGAASKLDPDNKIEGAARLSLNGQMSLRLEYVDVWTGRNFLSTGEWRRVYDTSHHSG